MRYSLVPFARFRLQGHSMEPTLKEGDFVLVYKWTTPKIGDVVAFKESEKVFIKRIKNAKNNVFFVEGDNKPDSLDSRKIGLIKKWQIIGKVVL